VNCEGGFLRDSEEKIGKCFEIFKNWRLSKNCYKNNKVSQAPSINSGNNDG
jgi:hypothetical protein